MYVDYEWGGEETPACHTHTYTSSSNSNNNLIIKIFRSLLSYPLSIISSILIPLPRPGGDAC